MVTEVRLPSQYKIHPELIVSGLDGKINYKVADHLQTKSLFSEFSSWGISGKIWFEKRENCWHSEIWKKGTYLASLTEDTIEDLLFNIQKGYGWK